VLFSTIFNISDLLVDKYVNSYQKSSEGSGFLRQKLKRRNEFAEKPTKHERTQLKILKIEICYDICLVLPK
jgi:hypothetical protein